MANGEVQENLNFSLHDSRVFAILRALSGKKIRSRKLKKELTEMNRETTTLCALAVLATVTLASPTENTYHAVTNDWYNGLW